MQYILLICVIIFIPLQSVVKKPYTDKTKGKGAYTFTAMLSLTAFVFFLVTGKGFVWNTAYLPYSIGFAISYIFAGVFTVLAISEGSVSLTTLVLKYSLVLPTLYGIILGEPISVFLILGISLLLVSMFLINKPVKGERFSIKWLIFALLALLGNGMCTITQKMHQQVHNNEFKNEFMLVALIISFIVSMLIALFTERRFIKCYIKVGTIPALLCGLMNGAVNLFVMMLNKLIPASVMFPLISAGGIVVAYVISKILYKEKLSKRQFIGLIIGIASVIFLSL